MKRFTAQVSRDPKGYTWEGEYGPEDGEPYELYTVLTGGSYDDLRELARDESIEWNVNTYDPFVVEPALFRIFAALEPTTDAIRRFANKYGDISPLIVMMEDGGHSFWHWKDRIETMRRGVEQADKIPKSRSRGHTNSTVHVLNEMLGEIDVYLRAYRQGHILGLQTEVYNLFDAMVLQLVDSIAEQKRYRNCEQCGKPFEVMPQINRADRIYCTANCRVKAYQRRKKEAAQMRHDGRTLRQIVKEMGSDMDTVKRWVKEVDSKEK